MRWPFRRKDAPAARQKSALLTQPSERGWFKIFESYTGAWQQDVTVDRNKVLGYHAIFSCITLIAADISKLRVKLVKKDSTDIWTEVPKGKYSVLDRPNAVQNRIQFFENWLISKLSRGNTYVLKQRDKNGDVSALHILDPNLVTPLISSTGEVFYRLQKDNFAGLTEAIIAPASEIIHDRYNCLFHPLVGLSPIFACGVSAVQGMNILTNSAKFFGNQSRPSGVLSAPGDIGEATIKELKDNWQTNYGGDNIGKVAVLGNDLKFNAISITAEDAQLVDQLKLSAEIVCSTYHVPKYKVIGDPPSYNNIESLELQYYSQGLQNLIEAIELCLKDGLSMPEDSEVKFDIEGLARMDSQTQINTLSKAVGGGISTPNEARKKLNLKPIKGGDTVYLQQQQYSLEALAKRDAGDNPFGKSGAPAQLTLPPPADPAVDEMNKLFDTIEIVLQEAVHHA